MNEGTFFRKEHVISILTVFMGDLGSWRVSIVCVAQAEFVNMISFE